MKPLLLAITALLAIGIAGPLHAENERVCWLSDLDLTKVKQSCWKPSIKDKTCNDKPLTIAGKTFERGFQTTFGGEGGYGAFELDLKPGVLRFLASVGVNDQGDFCDPVEFLVYGDNELLWSSGKMQMKEAAKPVDVPLAGKKRLLLLVKTTNPWGGGNGDWADARILLDVGKTGDLVSVASPEPAEILTPKPGPEPKINGARVFGVRPGNPFFFKIPAAGIAPITFGAKNLPDGLKVDPKTGVITGSISKVGEYKATLTAKNAKGQDSRPFKIVVGEKLALTPPMGWASYNCWGCDITDERMRAIADAFVKTNLINHGWTYMNIDDGWQARVAAGRAGEARKAPDFALQPNERFPDMKGLCDYVHGLGLKIGTYSTPWKISYGGYTGGSGNDEKGTIDHEGQITGKYTFEVQDAKQWAAWGFDSMKYDWRPNDVPNTKRMSDALRNCGRDILLTLSNSADLNQADKWAEFAQFWRTTGDITDNWWSVSDIGFAQEPWRKFAGPGHWNDPDMLVVGYVGWGKPRPTYLTPNEQYTHVSLWCLQSAPLLLGCDLSKADDFTISLLTNDEVLEVDQDPLGCAASRISQANDLEVWAKDMEDGSKAVGLFNRTLFPAKVTAKWSELGLAGPKKVRDLWRQKDLGVLDSEFSASIPRHGVVLVRIFSAKTQGTQNSISAGKPMAKETMKQGGGSKIEAFKKAIGVDRLPKFFSRLDALNKDLAAKGFVKFDGVEPMLTGYDYKQCYDWDLYFENIYLSHYGISDYCFNNFKVFMSTQQPDGFIPRAYGPLPWGKTQPFKPFLAQIAVLGSQQRGNDYEWLRASYYDGLKKYLDRWFAYDSDKNGLPVWDSSDASGMDNQISRGGGIGSFICEGTDLACYLYRELECMAFIAGKLGKSSDQKSFESRASALAKAVNTILWDQKDGFYYDRNEKTGAVIRVKSVAGFMPLWAGIATPERAARLVKEHLTNEKECWLKYPVTSYAATEPDYRQGGNNGPCNWLGTTWIPTNYMIMHGLLRYGFKDAARDLAYRTFRMALDENSATREYYDADTGKGNGMNPFWGWSSLAYVMPLEVELGYDPTQVKSKIQPWLSRDLGVPGPGSSQSK